MIRNDGEFIRLHNKLAINVATLPYLRLELIEAERQVANGFLGNAAMQVAAYYHCITNIREAINAITK